jgi:L-seryl-tRNA(Ser) seleniumtransferase
MTIYHELGIRPAINACGIYTDLGGAILSPAVWRAMSEANASFADIPDLLNSSGRMVAGWLEVRAARVTPGASAGIALATAACLTRGDGEASERLPDTTGLARTEVVIGRAHRYKYDRLVRLAGARLVVADDDDQGPEAALRAAIGSRTVAVLFPAHLDGVPGSVGLDETIALAQAEGVPVIVDAAYQVEPPSLMRTFTDRGADLACFSAKYFRGPNAGGIVVGRADLIAAVAAVDFTRHEAGPWLRFGRAFKLDRQVIVGTVAALREWLDQDHAARLAGYADKVDALRSGLLDIDGLSLEPICFTMRETYEPSPINALYVRLEAASGRSASAIDAALREGDPSIRTIVEHDGLAIVVETLRDDDVPVIVDAMRTALATAEVRGET